MTGLEVTPRVAGYTPPATFLNQLRRNHERPPPAPDPDCGEADFLKGRRVTPCKSRGGHHSQRSFLMSVLAFELEVTSYMTLNHVGGDAMVVPDELVGQSGTGKVGLRLRKDRLFRPSVHGDR